MATKKHIKMVIYGEPAVGKSTFAVKAPSPFFFCTDGNYEWLEDWGAKPEDHVQLFTWQQAKVEFGRDLSKYETIVVDLTEDLFKWCESEFCKKNNIAHVGDMGYGKGYDLSRNEFILEINKLLSYEDKNVILIMHGTTITQKDKRGVEYNKYTFSSRMPDKVADQIEGRVRYFLRAFALTEEGEGGKLVTNRYLSLQPDGTVEFGICRGLDLNKVPRNIPLDWDEFYAVVTNPDFRPTCGNVKNTTKHTEPELDSIVKPSGVNTEPKPKPEIKNEKVNEILTKKPSVSIKEITPKPEVKPTKPVINNTKSDLEKLAESIQPEEKPTEPDVSTITDVEIVKPVEENKEVKEELKPIEENSFIEKTEEVKVAEQKHEETIATTKKVDANEKLEALRQRMAALKAAQGK